MEQKKAPTSCFTVPRNGKPDIRIRVDTTNGIVIVRGAERVLVEKDGILCVDTEHKLA